MPERFDEYREAALAAYQPNQDAAEALVLADYFEERENPRLAATALDRAFGLTPHDHGLAERRKEILASLSVVEHGILFRYVPAGTFLMGSEMGDADERPVHPVRLPEYWVGETPVSWAAYCDLLNWEAPRRGFPQEELPERMMTFDLMNENKIRLQYCETETTAARDWHAHMPDDKWSSGQTSQEIFGEVPRENPDRPWEYDQKPMVAVSWQMAEELCRAISTSDVTYCLPSEAEWEKAARGGRIQQPYAWGNTLPNEENCDCNHFGGFYIRPPRSLPPNDYGLFGMCGGVWEWTRDRYDRLAYDENAPTDDETSPYRRVLRGGSWADCPEAVTVSFRADRGSSYWREREETRRSPIDADQWGNDTPTIGFRLFRFEGRRADS